MDVVVCADVCISVCRCLSGSSVMFSDDLDSLCVCRFCRCRYIFNISFRIVVSRYSTDMIIYKYNYDVNHCYHYQHPYYPYILMSTSLEVGRKGLNILSRKRS